MSGNSGSGGAASGFDRPFLPGYTTEWDPDAREWVATHDEHPDRILRGEDQDALEAARGQVVMDLAHDLLDITHYAATHGYTPPPQH